MDAAHDQNEDVHVETSVTSGIKAKYLIKQKHKHNKGPEETQKQKLEKLSVSATLTVKTRVRIEKLPVNFRPLSVSLLLHLSPHLHRAHRGSAAEDKES